MKRYILCLLSFLFIISSSFGFSIYNSNNVENQYFSINSPEVFIENYLNVSNFTVDYRINSNNLTKNYNFSNCLNSSNFCGSFSILDLIENSNNSFSGSNSFKINLGNESQYIYLDLEKPQFNLISYNIVSSNSSLFLNFNYSDNNQIDFVKLYSKSGSSLTFIADVSNRTNYSYKLSNSNNLTLVFKVVDKAGNSLNYQKIFQINDIFPPKIVSTFLTVNNSIYNLIFTAEDKNLSKYELINLDQVLSGNLSGNSLTKNIRLPFSNGNVILKVIDKQGNYINKTFELKTKFTSEFPSLYSNKKVFKFTSNANSCFLNRIDNLNKNIQFSKNSNTFSLSLDISDVKEYNLNIYCQDLNQREYYNVLFYYDTNKPSVSNISSELKDNGNIKISWSDAKDSESKISYILYKNSKKIYLGDKIYYQDSNVVWPNNYSYYLKVQDEAGNYINSNKLNLVPKKVDIIYTTNLQLKQNVSNNNFILNLKPEKNSNVNIIVENSGNIFFNKNYSNVNGNQLSLNLNLLEGINNVKLIIKDNYGNKIIRNYVINYNKPILAVKKNTLNEIKPNTVKTQVKPTSQISPVNDSVVLKTVKSDTFNIWVYIWIILILFIALYFIFYVLDYDLFFKENKKKRVNKNNFYSNNRKSVKKSSKFSFDFLAAKKYDSKLGKSLEKIKAQRIKRQVEKQLENDRKKRDEDNSKNLSYLQKKKLEDISNRKKYDFKVKTNYKKEESSKSNNLTLDTLINPILKGGDKIRSSINNQLDKRKTKKKQEQEKFDNYLEKVNNSVSYSNSTEYLLKTEIEKQRKKEELEKAKIAEQVKIQEEQAKINAEKQKKEQKKKEKELEKAKIKQEKSLAKDSLDDYLNKKTKKKSFYFAEKFVNKDLLKRKK